jgi:hypothetical protein
MIRLLDLLEDTGRTIHIYDFDDTLVDTNTSINVIDSEGNLKKLSSGEFATYTLKPGEKYDFTEFDKIIKDSKPILRNLLQIKKSASNPNIKTTILTARRVAYPIMRHLKEKYKLDVYVVGVGGANPELKADWIENQVKKGYKNIKFMDDSEKNLLAVKNRLSKYKGLNLDLIDAKK